MITVNLEFRDVLDARGFRHWLVFPSSDDPERTRQFMLMNIKKFLDTFGIEIENGFDLDELRGAVAPNVRVKYNEDEDGRAWNELVL